MQKRNYKRLTEQERESISRGLAQKKTIRAIAEGIKRAASSISREIKRNSGKSGYRAFSASQRAETAAASRKKGKSKSRNWNHFADMCWRNCGENGLRGNIQAAQNRVFLGYGHANIT